MVVRSPMPPQMTLAPRQAEDVPLLSALWHAVPLGNLNSVPPYLAVLIETTMRGVSIYRWYGKCAFMVLARKSASSVTTIARSCGNVRRLRLHW